MYYYVCYDYYIPASLEKITINDVVHNEAFKNCGNLTSVVIGDGVTAVGDSAFDGCSKLTSVTFAEGSQLSSIGKGAFNNCFKLETVYYTGTANDWNGISIDDRNSDLTNVTRYYYSETNVAGCWHYVDGKPTLW